jgi:hypothetical protein
MLTWRVLSSSFVLLLCILESVLSLKQSNLEVHNFCGHQHIVDQLKSLPQVHQNYQTESARFLKRNADQNYTTNGLVTDSDFQPIRILFDLRYLEYNADSQACYSAGTIVTLGNSTQYQCTSADVISPIKVNNTALIVTALQSIIASKMHLRTLRVLNSLFLDPTVNSCGFDNGVPVPTQYQQFGIPNTDLVVFVTARPMTIQITMSIGAACQEDQFGRAIAGQLNLNPQVIPTTPLGWQQFTDIATQIDYLVPPSERLLVYSMLHEFIHLLGFTTAKFSDFRSQTNLSEVLPLNSTLSVTVPALGPTLYQIITPNALYQTQQQFGCGNIAGVNLETWYGGINSTLGPHWARSLLMNELMTVIVNEFPVLSTITLGLLQDSGWYRVNYSALGNTFHWGQEASCHFVLEDCGQSWPPVTDFGCDVIMQYGCTYDYRYRGYCNLMSYSQPLPPEYRHFSDPTLGGSDPVANYCPYFSAWSDGDCTNSSYPLDPAQQALVINQFGENRALNSRCFVSNANLGESVRPEGYDGGCFSTLCAVASQQDVIHSSIGEWNTSNPLLVVRVGAAWYPCNWPGRELHPVGYTGEVLCPQHPEWICDGITQPTQNIDSWPVITSIDPAVASRDTVVTFTGRNFVSGMSIWLQTTSYIGNFTNVNVQSSTLATAVSPGITNATADRTLASVVLSVPDPTLTPPSRTYVLIGGFTVLGYVPDPPNLLDDARAFLFGPLLALTIIIIIVGSLAIIIGVIVCFVQMNRYLKGKIAFKEDSLSISDSTGE